MTEALTPELQHCLMNSVIHSADLAYRVIAEDAGRPHVLMRPVLSLDGNSWCALYGSNQQDGVAGFGDSPYAAMQDFDRNWYAKIKPACLCPHQKEERPLHGEPRFFRTAK